MSTLLARRAATADPGAADALFREARRRRRRRRLAGTTAVVVAATAATVLFAVTGTRGPAGAGREQGRPGRAGQAQAGAAPAIASPVTAVWYDGTHLRIGSIQPHGGVTQRVAAEVNADTLPLVPAGGRVYWVDQAGTFVPALGHWSEVVQYLDVATGRVGTAGPGQTVFLSADGRDLFMSQTATSVTETPVRGGGTVRLLTLPGGWYLPGGDGLGDLVSGAGLATANGLVVQSRDGWDPGGSVLGLWNPDGGRVVVVGRALTVIDAYTPPGARYSLLAWIPAACLLPGNCPVKITNTATLSTRTVRSPLPGGFAMGGAFSPTGTRLAVFLNAGTGQAARLALVDPVTGAIRVVPAPALGLGMDLAWARWLPGGERLIVGAGTGSAFLVDAVAPSTGPGATRPFVTGGGSTDGPNYTTAIVSPRT
ncbi:MAG TPA: hypothetical protein VIX15_17120 [Streptosporangiaceae bacterium]